MDNNTNHSNYFKWFLIVNCVSFIGGIIDSFIWIPYGRDGGLGGFPVFSLIGAFLGCVCGIIYSLICLNNDNLSRNTKIIQLIISICVIFVPILAIMGAALGWAVGYALVELFYLFV